MKYETYLQIAVEIDPLLTPDQKDPVCEDAQKAGYDLVDQNNLKFVLKSTENL